MNRIIIIGSCGAGKSTLAVELGKITGLPVIHLDYHHWKPGWVEVEEEEWVTKVHELCSGERWIIDGNFNGTMEYRMSKADTVVFLDFPRLQCIWGIFKRSLFRKRIDPIPGCPPRVNLEFIHYVWMFPAKKIPLIRKLIRKFYDKRIFIARTRKDLNSIKEEIAGFFADKPVHSST